MARTVPASRQPLDALTEPFPLTLAANQTCVFQAQAICELLVRVRFICVALPLAGTLPVPDQPTHTYCVPVPPDSGEFVTAHVTTLPAG